MDIEEILLEAENLGIRHEVLKKATDLLLTKEVITQLEAYEQAYKQILQQRT